VNHFSGRADNYNADGWIKRPRIAHDKIYIVDSYQPYSDLNKHMTRLPTDI
jgi:hypothetical protein